MTGLAPDPGDDEYEFVDDGLADPPSLEVEITDPQVLGVLYGPDGEPAWTLLDRRPITFGYCLPEEAT